MGRTLFDKLWDSHVVHARDDGATLLYIDRHFLHEGSFQAFAQLDREGRAVRRPDRTFAFADHYVQTDDRQRFIEDAEVRERVEMLDVNCDRVGIRVFGAHHADQGIVHVAGPELGLTWPGLTIVCGDSHTSTHGAFGALAFGIGASEVTHVMATQTLWQERPGSMAVTVDGRLPFGTSAKDLVLHLIAAIGAGGALRHAVEYRGPAIEALSMEGRMTVCNMSIEAGARMGMVAPDETTYAYLEGRELAPKDWAAALAHWRTLHTDADATFDREVHLDAGEITPTVTWGTSPQDALPITGRVPDPAQASSSAERARLERALAYMDLRPGTPLEGIAVDQVFLGSCTNARIEDLRAAAEVVRGRRAVVPAWVVPGSRAVKRAAEQEGLDRVFTEAGFEWRDAGCSMCLGLNGDTLQPGQRSASTTNRNFEGRQGRGARTHLLSPTMAAAAAVTGHLCDVRKLGSA